jgi:replication factor A3
MHMNLIEISACLDFDLCRTVVELTQLPSVKGLFVNDGSSGGGGYN